MSTALGLRLREEREKSGQNQADFARAGGVGRTSQTEYESGKTAPTADYLERVSAAGIDVAYVITGVRTIDSLGPDEAELISKLRQLSPNWRQLCCAMVEAALSDGN